MKRPDHQGGWRVHQKSSKSMAAICWFSCSWLFFFFEYLFIVYQLQQAIRQEYYNRVHRTLYVRRPHPSQAIPCTRDRIPGLPTSLRPVLFGPATKTGPTLHTHERPKPNMSPTAVKEGSCLHRNSHPTAGTQQECDCENEKCLTNATKMSKEWCEYGKLKGVWEGGGKPRHSRDGAPLCY